MLARHSSSMCAELPICHQVNCSLDRSAWMGHHGLTSIVQTVLGLDHTWHCIQKMLPGLRSTVARLCLAEHARLTCSGEVSLHHPCTPHPTSYFCSTR